MNIVDVKMLHKEMDVDLAKGLGLHMILIWGRVALVQGIPIIFQHNPTIIVACTSLLIFYYIYIFFIKHQHIPGVNQGTVLVAFFVITSITFTFVFWPGNVQFFDPIGNTLIYEILPFIILGMMVDIDHLYQPMIKASKILLLLCTISSFGIAINGHTTVSTWSSYSMPLSYATLYAVMWLISDFFKEKKAVSLVLSIIGILILIIFGSRNTLLSVAAILFILTVYGRKKNTFLKLLLLQAAAISIVFWRDVLGFVGKIAHTLGVSSRTVDIFLRNDFLFDNRLSIHQNIFRVLDEHPFGVGIAGDVAQTKEFAHSLYVSILCTYGYIFGALIIFVIGFILLTAYRKSVGPKRDILLIYILSVIPRGFTGGDIWSSDVFWWMLGIALSIIYGQRDLFKVEVGSQ